MPHVTRLASTYQDFIDHLPDFLIASAQIDVKK
jgi:hypothetical protein